MAGNPSRIGRGDDDADGVITFWASDYVADLVEWHRNRHAVLLGVCPKAAKWCELADSWPPYSHKLHQVGALWGILKGSWGCWPQRLFKIPQMPSNGGHKALNREVHWGVCSIGSFAKALDRNHR